MNNQIEVVEGNIVKQHTGAIVNAAQENLLGEGGVDGAIHAAAGPELLEECKTLHGCPTGEARLTRGYRLQAKWIIHTVGPVWRGGRQNENELLANCYRNSLALAEQHGIKTVAFPAISTGLYRFPIERAARIALTEVHDFLTKKSKIEKVVFVCYGRDAYHTYLELRKQLGI
jgi:O-acetyl-ADP-ribose deacetylase (regulator of RNase III)